MPIVSKGIIEPPVVPLFPASEAMIPGSYPVPNFSGNLEEYLACPYATTLAVAPPIPGKIPMKKPVKVDRKRLNQS